MNYQEKEKYVEYLSLAEELHGDLRADVHQHQIVDLPGQIAFRAEVIGDQAVVYPGSFADPGQRRGGIAVLVKQLLRSIQKFLSGWLDLTAVFPTFHVRPSFRIDDSFLL